MVRNRKGLLVYNFNCFILSPSRTKSEIEFFKQKIEYISYFPRLLTGKNKHKIEFSYYDLFTKILFLYAKLNPAIGYVVRTIIYNY